MPKTKIFTLAACAALALALAGVAGCSGNSPAPANSSAAETANAENAANAEKTSENATEPNGGEANSAEPSDAADMHAAYFVGKWDLYENEDATHEQIVALMDEYANNKETHAKMDEAYGRENIEFCARFNADGTGEMDTGAEIVSFTWEAANEGAVTFTSFGGKETALHIPVIDGKFTLNGDTYAKAE